MTKEDARRALLVGAGLVGSCVVLGAVVVAGFVLWVTRPPVEREGSYVDC